MSAKAAASSCDLWQEAADDEPQTSTASLSRTILAFRRPVCALLSICCRARKSTRPNLGGANGLSFVLPLAAVSNQDNLADGLAMCEGKPDAFLLDDILTDEEVQQFFVGAAPAAEAFTIGVSNPFISSEYRTQMIAELIEVNKEYMDQGITTELVIESADTDVAGQIQQLQNLMAKNVDAILVNPGDVSGLNATLQEALDKGIIVISVDQELNVPGVYNVGIDQKEWATTSAEWLAEKLGGKGDIVLIEGFPGHPANVARMDGVAEVFAKYPGHQGAGAATPANGTKRPDSR